MLVLEELTVLASSVTSKPMPKWMSAAAIAFGVVFLVTAYRAYAASGLVGKVVYNLFVGTVCLYGAGISRRLYLSDVGVVREMHSWGRITRRVLPWDDVRHVSLAFRANSMMAFFEVDVTGWKVLFSREQEREVREVLEEMLPDVDVAIIGKG